MSPKKVGHFYFYHNFGKRGPICHILSLLTSERICGRSWKYHLPTNLWKVVNYTASQHS